MLVQTLRCLRRILALNEVSFFNNPNANLRNQEKLTAAFSSLIRQSSSLNVTSRLQCKLFSTCQCVRAARKIGAGLSGANDEIRCRLSTITSPVGSVRIQVILQILLRSIQRGSIKFFRFSVPIISMKRSAIRP